jgi:hypothetical protein
VATGRHRLKRKDQARNNPDKSEGIKMEALPLNWSHELKIYLVIRL